MKKPSKTIFKEKLLDIAILSNILSPSERVLLQEQLRESKFEKGDCVFSAGERLKSLQYLHKGKVKLLRKGVDKRIHITQMLNQGQFFGMHSYFAQQACTSSAIALENCIVYTLPFEVFEQLLHSSHPLCKFFLELQAREIFQAQEYCINLTQKQLKGRLASALLFLVKTYGFEPDHQTINVSLCREDLANLANMTNSNAIRTLSSFASQELLELKGRKIKIRQLEALTELAEGL